ncbi:MAG: SGNH/GDSL hydrolase family protein [Clostridia bacterium]|nr:SGNH/GDSL hydrolase family protein [Clostridia bacterium]
MKIVLIGDSIMFGTEKLSGYGLIMADYYEKAGKGEVILPIENCQDTRLTSSALVDLFENRIIEDADIVHWNNGLWDVLHFMGADRCCVSQALYVKLLEKIYLKLKEVCPRAKIIFATSTPIREDIEIKIGYRKNSDIEAYNRLAKEYFKDKDVVINDLYSFAKSTLLDKYAESDPTHFSDEASELFAKHIIKLIEEVQNDK